MRILFVTSTLSSGGSERVMSLLANQFAHKNYDVEIICLNKHIVFYPIAEQVKLIFVEDEISSKSIIKKILWLRAHVKEASPNVVIPFMTDVYCVTLLSLIGLRIPVISSERIDPRYSDPLRKIMRKIFIPFTTHLVVQTESIKSYYPKWIRRKTSVIFNPVTEKVFTLDDQEKKDTIVSVGRLAKQKNHKMLITAFSKICKDFPSYKMIIWGEGPLRNELETYISTLGLQNRILLPGRSEDVINEMNHSKLFCLTSDGEGMSNAMIEAICLGLPVITTNVSGAGELIRNGVNGYVIERGNEDKFASAMTKLLSNETLMNSMSQENKKLVNHFVAKNIVDRWDVLINSILKI
jgi:glycosyltransferase involved in cell wall biosynthesis